MDDKKLDAILQAIARERHIPPEELVTRTKAAIRGRRLLRVVVFLSLCAQLLAVGVAMYLLISPDVEPAAKVFGLVSLFAYVGSLMVAAVAARGRVIWFFRRVEKLIG